MLKIIRRSRRSFKVLDGGTGTEIEKRLRVVDQPDNAGSAWVAATHLFRPDIVKEVHQKYIEAGADIITANTYATNRHVLKAAGLEHQTESAIRKAVAVAREAAASPSSGGRKISVAGSLSCHPPDVKLVDGVYLGQWPEAKKEFQNYQEAFEILLEENVDYIFIELMKDLEHSPLLLQAVAERMGQLKGNHPPVHLGISTRRSRDTGNLCLFERSHEVIFNEQLLKLFLNIFEIRDAKLSGLNIMHTNFADVGPSIEMVKKVWDGDIGCYPDHGFYKVPEWVFEDIEIDQAMEFARGWRKQGVEMIGGCCGVGPDFIEAVSQEFKTS